MIPLVAARTPLLPLHAVTGVYDSPDPVAALRTLLETNPLVRQALEVASPSLNAAVAEWLREPSPRTAGVPMRALAYVARMSARATPFGLCAGIGLVAIGDRTTLGVDEGARGTHTRPDMGLLFDAVEAIERSDLRRSVSYLTNQGVIERGGRLYVTNVALCTLRQNGGQATTAQRPVTLKHTAAVRYVRDLARQGARYATLANALSARFEAPLDACERVLDRLIEAGVLISELRASPIGDPVAYLLDRLRRIDPAAAQEFRSGVERASALDAMPLSMRALDDYRAVAEIFARLSDKRPDRAVQIDLHSPFSGSLGKNVLGDVERAAEFFLRSGSVPRMSTLRERFEQRYEGRDRLVPLLELVDANLGLGHPEPPEMQGRKDGESRDALLLQIACDAQRAGTVEIVLGAPALERLVGPLRDDAATSMEIGFHIAASSAQAVERGDYLVVPAAFFGSPRAARSLGRFAHVFGDAALERIRAVVASACDPDALNAEIAFGPPSSRSYNVVVRPQLLPAEIPIGVMPNPGCDALALDDLWVGLDDDGFYLWSGSRERRVTPHESHVFATERSAPNVCSFLAALAHEGRCIPAPFDWGAASRLTYLPRLRAGRVVIAPRQWRFALPEEERGTEAVSLALARWRDAWGLPRYVYLVEADNRLLLDLHSPVAARLLHDQLPEDGFVTFIEALPSPHEHWTSGASGAYAVEFVASIVRAGAPRRPAPRPAAVPIPERVRYGPGSHWTYAKLYAGEQVFDDLLLRAILPEMDLLRGERAIDRWFFVRYADPAPHLRLRVRALPEAAARVREHLVCASERWLREGRIARCAFDTYDPEYERYGIANFDAVEAFFTYDSDLCARALSAAGDGSDARVYAAVESFVPIVESADLVPLALSALEGGKQRKILDADRDSLRRIAAARFDPAAGSALPAALGRDDREARFASHFHMHCNRLGVGGELEARAIALLRAALLSRSARGRVSANTGKVGEKRRTLLETRA